MHRRDIYKLEPVERERREAIEGKRIGKFARVEDDEVEVIAIQTFEDFVEDAGRANVAADEQRLPQRIVIVVVVVHIDIGRDARRGLPSGAHHDC